MKLLPGIIACIFLPLYFFPNAIEAASIRRGAPAVALFLFGDLLGCAVINAVVNRRWAIGVYLLSSVAECALFYLGAVSMRSLIWVTDLAPAMVLATLATRAAIRGRNWRPSIRRAE
jgi:hypothetical protein